MVVDGCAELPSDWQAAHVTTTSNAVAEKSRRPMGVLPSRDRTLSILPQASGKVSSTTHRHSREEVTAGDPSAESRRGSGAASVADNPGRRAPDLAASLGRETEPFKRDVRKLKNLGLTHSLDVGYRISPRGVAYLAATPDGP
ncbi:hypothetical protein [Rhodococcus jostii]|nr:hypothetical protein [Rhodococcus jostii]